MAMPKLFGWLPQARWKRWLVLTAIAAFLFFSLVITLVITAFLLWHISGFQEWVTVKMVRHQLREPAQVPPKALVTPEETARLATNATTLRLATELFQPTNVWDVQLRFTSNQWARLGPNTVPPIVPFLRQDGSVILRNPKASRNGLAGVFGLDLPWSAADLTFGDLAFHNVGARFKGNGTFINAQRTYKRPFKIELNKFVKSQLIAGRATLNFHNLTADASCMSDTLGYEFFRDAGVPASRTAFARLRLTIDGRFDDRLLGLYVLVENPDTDWAEEQFGTKGIALFKPVTYELFKDLGGDWSAYEGIYDPKTKIKPKQSRRLIALARLVTHADDVEFAAHVGDFVDLEEFARFLACQVLLSNYDGPLSNGQNFLLYLDPRTERFGFIPWDLDQAWGEFPFTGSLAQKERASIWHPWVGENRFLDRMLKAAAVRERYRRELERIRTSLFLPDRLNQKVDKLVPLLRPFIAEESTDRLSKFQREVGDERVGSPGTNGPAPRKLGYTLKRFFAARAESVTDQLNGRAEGVIITRQSR